MVGVGNDSGKRESVRTRVHGTLLSLISFHGMYDSIIEIARFYLECECEL